MSLRRVGSQSGFKGIRNGSAALFGLPSLRTLAVAGVFLLAGAALAFLYFRSPHVTLRVTTGLQGTAGEKFIAAFVAVTKAAHPRVNFELVPVANAVESSKAMEGGKVDLAVVRTDVSPPSNGQTVAILRKDVVAFVVPADSSLDDPSELAGKTIALPEGPAQEYNSKTLDTILSYFNVAPDRVKRIFLPIAEIGTALHHKHAAAALAIGPVGPGEAVNVVAAVAKATRGAPKILAMDQADAIVKRFPQFESMDVPEGAFKGHPPTPDDTVTCLAISYRFVVPDTMLSVVAGLIGKSIFDTKEKLMAASPIVSQIEAPDTDSTSPLLPIHPGVSSYLSSGNQSFLDALQSYVYIIGIPLSLFGSLGAVLFGQLRNKKLVTDQQQVYEILVIADTARTADETEVDRLEGELNALVTTCVNKMAAGSTAASQLPVSSLAIDHARRAIDKRRRELTALPPAPIKEAG